MIDYMLVLAGESAYACDAPRPTHPQMLAGRHAARVASACRAYRRDGTGRCVGAWSLTDEQIRDGRRRYPEVYYRSERTATNRARHVSDKMRSENFDRRERWLESWR